MPFFLGFYFVIFTLLFSLPANCFSNFENPPIRVRLKTAMDHIELEGLGLQIHSREKNFEAISIPQRQRVSIRRLLVQGHLMWSVQRSPEQKIELIADQWLAIRAIEIRENGKLLPNQIFFAAHSALKFDLIGVLPLENYLVGVLASEMPLSWPLETLKAQAVAARSYALVTMRQRAKQTFHVESSVMDQVFSAIGNRSDASPLVAKAQLAVDSTQGMVLLSPTRQLLKAYYHSDCGGKTVSGSSVWGAGSGASENGEPAVDSSCPSNPKANWRLQVSVDTLSEKLKTFFRRPGLGHLLSMQLIRPTKNDRVEQVDLSWDSGEYIKIKAHDFRSSLGYDQIRSTLFEFQKGDDGFIFSGRGFGHGVGLCQWGAKELGKQGQSFRQILQHYYAKALLQESVPKPALTDKNLKVRTARGLEIQTTE